MTRITEKRDIQDRLLHYLQGQQWTFIPRDDLPAWRGHDDREPFLVDVLRRQPELDNPTILIVVDRLELESQMLQNLEAFGLPAIRAESRTHLAQWLAADTRGVLVTTVLLDLDEHLTRRRLLPGSCFTDHSLSDVARTYRLSTGVHFRGTHGMFQRNGGVQISVHCLAARLTHETHSKCMPDTQPPVVHSSGLVDSHALHRSQRR
ncbi:MAG: hypothetical protein KGS73_12525 [Chloroflexi bacterium]|jgi:hypothetical protein|nr:hypothetical protein [Chloroflexota bacterium]